MRSSQNIPLPPKIYPPFPQLYATLPESTPPFRIYAPFLQFYVTLPVFTHPSQNLPLLTCLSIYMRASQNLPPPLSATIIIYDTPRIYPSPINICMRPSQNLPIPPRRYPFFYNCMRSSHNIPFPPIIYPTYLRPFQKPPTPPRIGPIPPPLFQNYIDR